MLVSICMATYNGGKFIREQVDSILNQEFKVNQNVELELVVSDDGSTDDTIPILEAYHDARNCISSTSLVPSTVIPASTKYRVLGRTMCCRLCQLSCISVW